MTEILHSIWTLLLFMAFIGIILWAWSGKRRNDFAEAARLPLDDEPAKNKPVAGDTSRG